MKIILKLSYSRRLAVVVHQIKLNLNLAQAISMCTSLNFYYTLHRKKKNEDKNKNI